MAPHSVHVKPEDLHHIREVVSARYQARMEDTSAWVVGSAKLGFAVTSKSVGEEVLPAFRPFSPRSDIDVALVSTPIFDLIWDELSSHAHRSAHFPWDSGRLGDYLVCGWLRPDHFPKVATLRRCSDWWQLFNQLSGELRFNRRKVRGALFYSESHMRQYFHRGLTHCAREEAIKQ